MTVHEMPPGSDIWALDADLYIIPTNCKGVFGGGLAKQFVQMFGEDVVKRYKTDCANREVGPGCIHIEPLGANPWGALSFAALFAVEDDPIEHADLRWIDAGLQGLWHVARMSHICPRGLVAMPALGCGLGGLPFDQVRAAVLQHFDSEPRVQVALFPPR